MARKPSQYHPTCTSCGVEYRLSAEEQLMGKILGGGQYCPACREYAGYGMKKCPVCNNKVLNEESMYLDGVLHHSKCAAKKYGI